MPAAKQVIAIEIDDCKISELTADTGASPTYATAIDVPNIVSMQVQPQLRSATLEGDAVVDSVYSKVTHATGSIQFRSVPMDVLGVMLGASVTQSGTTPNQTTVLAIGENAKGKFFKLQGRAVNVEGIDATAAAGLKAVVYKAKLTGTPQITFNEGFADLTAEYTAVRTRSDRKLFDITVEETQTVIS